MFRSLGAAQVGAEVRQALVYPLEQTFKGSIVRMEASYCFIAREQTADWIHAHRNKIDEGTWGQLVVGKRVSFQIAFTFKGPSAFNLEIEGR